MTLGICVETWCWYLLPRYRNWLHKGRSMVDDIRFIVLWICLKFELIENNWDKRFVRWVWLVTNKKFTNKVCYVIALGLISLKSFRSISIYIKICRTWFFSHLNILSLRLINLTIYRAGKGRIIFRDIVGGFLDTPRTKTLKPRKSTKEINPQINIKNTTNKRQITNKKKTQTQANTENESWIIRALTLAHRNSK